MTRTTNYQYDALRQALTAGEKQHEMVERYHVNVEFKRGIDTLAAVLPIFVESLAKHCDEQAVLMEHALKQAQIMPPMPTVYCAGCVDRDLPHADRCKNR